MQRTRSFYVSKYLYTWLETLTGQTGDQKWRKFLVNHILKSISCWLSRNIHSWSCSCPVHRSQKKIEPNFGREGRMGPSSRVREDADVPWRTDDRRRRPLPVVSLKTKLLMRTIINRGSRPERIQIAYVFRATVTDVPEVRIVLIGVHLMVVDRVSTRFTYLKKKTQI